MPCNKIQHAIERVATMHLNKLSLESFLLFLVQKPSKETKVYHKHKRWDRQTVSHQPSSQSNICTKGMQFEATYRVPLLHLKPLSSSRTPCRNCAAPFLHYIFRVCHGWTPQPFTHPTLKLHPCLSHPHPSSLHKFEIIFVIQIKSLYLNITHIQLRKYVSYLMKI